MTTETLNLFAIPVMKLSLPETPELKEQFLPEILRRYEENLYSKPKAWETDRVHTSFEAPKKDMVINFMPPVYEKLIRQFVHAQEFRVHLWHNVYWKHEEYQERHEHVPYSLSFIHFLSFDKSEHKPPIFYDPARHIKAYIRHEAIAPELFTDRAQPDVDEGDVLVFPSYLEHHVPPGQYTKPRVTIAMNVALFSHLN